MIYHHKNGSQDISVLTTNDYHFAVLGSFERF